MVMVRYDLRAESFELIRRFGGEVAGTIGEGEDDFRRCKQEANKGHRSSGKVYTGITLINY